MGFNGSGSISVGAGIAGATQHSVLFVGPGGVLAENNNLFRWRDDFGTLTIGGAQTLARVNIKGLTTDAIMYWEGDAASKSVLISPNGFSVNNIGIPFHINLNGTTGWFEIGEDATVGREANHAFKIPGNVPNRTVPVVVIRGGPTPTATAHLLSLRTNDETEVTAVDRAGNVLLAAKYIRIKEGGDPGAGGVADHLSLYSKDVAGLTVLAYRDSSGAEHIL